MPDPTARPDHLPDFSNPPLNEVVMGIQFDPLPGYKQIFAGQIWDLFRDRYPNVQEQPLLAPAFETFGLPSTGFQPPIRLLTGAPHCRFWFKAPEDDQLIQFQEDRLLHNWRKVGGGTNHYPRFEAMIASFADEIGRLQNYLKEFGRQDLNINQCEITYINHIPLTSSDLSLVSDWLAFMNFADRNPDDFSVAFRETIEDDKGLPIGRLTCEAGSAISEDGKNIIALNLTVRGIPKTPAFLRDALDFLALGREIIVTRFTQITTPKAHQAWGRIK